MTCRRCEIVIHVTECEEEHEGFRGEPRASVVERGGRRTGLISLLELMFGVCQQRKCMYQAKEVSRHGISKGGSPEQCQTPLQLDRTGPNVV